VLQDLLRDLVAIDSVNPGLVPGARGEADIAAHCEGWMRRAGFDVELQEAAPGRPNAVGVIERGSKGPSLMFCGHIDTVGVDGMRAPFTPDVRGGRLYGRGSQDMKGGVAAMMEAARRAKDRWRSGRLIVACVCDEEFESVGAQALVTRFKADAAVVTEPTSLQIAITHKGFAWIEVATRGRAAHGSRPAEGRDAILRMGRVLSKLEMLTADLAGRAAELFGRGRVSRAAVIQAYTPALTLPVDVTRGRAVFADVCASCHRLDGVGVDLGPSLEGIRTHGPEGLLVDILDPNRKVDPGYLFHQVERRDGTSVLGAIVDDQAGSLTIAQAGGQRVVVPRTDVQRIRSVGRSLMPDGLESAMTHQDLADLIAYLLSR